MNPAINLYCQPTPRMSGQIGLPIQLQTDEAGQPLEDEAGDFLKPDPQVAPGDDDES
jgi:hypothetical protein